MKNELKKYKRKEDWEALLVGNTFNWLTVISIEQAYCNGRKRGYLAVCKCKCGKVCKYQADALYRNAYYSYGCYRRSSEIVEKQHCWQKDESRMRASAEKNRQFKKIAIEYNGSYWHDENHKPRDYHYSKFRACLEKGILLISIFELEWNSRKEEIKQYIQDTFSDRVNNLSFITNHIMNNNYPVRSYAHLIGDYIEDSYIYNNASVYTCGHSIMPVAIG